MKYGNNVHFFAVTILEEIISKNSIFLGDITTSSILFSWSLLHFEAGKTINKLREDTVSSDEEKNSKQCDGYRSYWQRQE